MEAKQHVSEYTKKITEEIKKEIKIWIETN